MGQPRSARRATQAGDVEPETPEERSARIAREDAAARLKLHKERVGFYVQEAIPYGLGLAMMAGAFLYCLVMLVRAGTPPAERDRAWTMVSVIMTGVLAFVFGKSTK